MSVILKDHVNIPDAGDTTVEVALPNAILYMVDELAARSHISRTEALIQAVATTKELVDRAPNGARITPIRHR